MKKRRREARTGEKMKGNKKRPELRNQGEEKEGRGDETTGEKRRENKES